MLALIAPLAAAFAPPLSPRLKSSVRRGAARGGLFGGGDTQVVTDIDDTVKSSGGLSLAGIPLGGVDTSYARGSFYPGVFQFGLELSCARLPPGRPPARVAVLTARAVEFKALLEIKQSSKLCVRYRDAAQRRLRAPWGVGPVLYGSVQEWVCQERKGWRKAANFELLRAEAPAGRRFIFVGDNGASEKDLDAAERITRRHPGLVRAVFMHAVSPGATAAPLPPDGELHGVPLLYFRTYASAAAKAHQLGLIGRCALARVLDSCEEEMAADSLNLPPGSPNERLLVDEVRSARPRGWLLRRRERA